MERMSKKIAYSAISAAIGAVCIILTNLLPLTVALLMFASVCYYIAFSKCGIVYGFLSIAASMLIGFFSFGVSGGFVLTGVVFAPYSILAYFIRKLYYNKPKPAIIRVAVMAVFANLALLFSYLLAKVVGIDFTQLLSYVGNLYFILAIIVTALFVAFDFLFLQVTLRLCKLIK